MLEKSLFKKAFALLFIVGLMSVADNFLYLTWIYWWFDMVMHFTAGGVVGMATIITCVYFSRYVNDKTRLVLCAVGAGLVVGLLWEVFELYFNLTTFSDGMVYVTDTLSDLFLDMSGALLFSVFSIRHIKR